MLNLKLIRIEEKALSASDNADVVDILKRRE